MGLEKCPKSPMQPGLGTLACETTHRGPGLLGGFPEKGREGPLDAGAHFPHGRWLLQTRR